VIAGQPSQRGKARRTRRKRGKKGLKERESKRRQVRDQFLEPVSVDLGGGKKKNENQMLSFYGNILLLIWIDPPLPKPVEKFKQKEKKENELMRRWKVLIQGIEIVNTSQAIFDPFVQFIIGGNYFVNIFETNSHILIDRNQEGQ